MKRDICDTLESAPVNNCVCGRQWKPEIETGCRVECFHIYGEVLRPEEEVKQTHDPP
jgi:hypothetical protein